jgi:hypothetical protein
MGRRHRIQWWQGGVVLAGGLLAVASGLAAEHDDAAVAAPQPVTPTDATPAPVSAPPVQAPDQAKVQEDEIRSQLNGTRWAIESMPIGGAEKAKAQKDTLTFDARQISSERLSKAGYAASNYTVTIGDDGVAVWETMQTKEGEGVAFWRCELHGSTMRGVLSKHPLEGATEDYSISGQPAKGSSKSPEASGAAAASSTSDRVAPAGSDSPTGAGEPPSKKSKKKSKKGASD